MFLPCRVEVLIQCDAGTYQLQSGTGKTFTQDPGCGSSHCDVYQQPIVATIEVVGLYIMHRPNLPKHRQLILSAIEVVGLHVLHGPNLPNNTRTGVQLHAEAELAWLDLSGMQGQIPVKMQQ